MSEIKLPQDPAEENKTKTPRKPNKKLLRWILLGVAVLIVILVVAALLFPRIINLDRVGRLFTYLGSADNENYGRIRFDSNSTDSYALLGNRFAVGCEDGMYFYDDNGEQTALVQGSLPYPKISTGRNIALCYSNESSTLVAMNKKGETVLKTTASGAVLDAEVSPDGCICYASADSGCKTVVTVMNKKLHEVFRWKSFSQYINCCAVSSKAGRLAVAGLNQSDGVFCSTLSILRTDSENDALIASAELGNQIIFELWFLQDDSICAIGETSTMFFDKNGKLLQTFDYDGMSLTDFCKNESGNLFLSFDRKTGGADALLVSFDADGTELARQTFEQEIRSISANGEYLAVLTEQMLSVMSAKLELFDSSEQQTAANRVLARKDGTVLLVSNGQTSLYIP